MKIAHKFGKIVVRLSKIGCKMAKIVYLYIFYVHFSYEDCILIVNDCTTYVKDWPQIGQDCITCIFIC